MQESQLMTIPNLLTLTRIALVPFFIALLVLGYIKEALYLFFVASITDALDGFIARRFHQVSKIGKFLDPAADKFFLVSSFTAAYFLDMIPLWLFVVAFMKDAVLLAGLGALRLRGRKIEIDPTFAGKTSTTLQLITILLLLLNILGIVPGSLFFVCMVITAILLFYSMISYVIIGFRIDAGKEGSHVDRTG